MPGKYSYNAVLSDYSSQGLIPLSNNKQIDSEREAGTNATHSANRSRSHPALKGNATHANAPVSGQRIVIQDSDSESESRPHARAHTFQSHRVSHMPQRQTRFANTTQRKQVRIEKPLPSPPTTSTPERRRPGGVRAFIAARYQEETSALPDSSASVPDLSLHEFLDSVPRSPERTKRQPRDDHLVRPKSNKSSHSRDISVTEFLNLVPGPSPEPMTGRVTTQKPSISPSAQPSPLVSRLPRGVQLPARPTRVPSGGEKNRELQQPLHPEPNIRKSVPDSKTPKQQPSQIVAAARLSSKSVEAASRKPPSKPERGQPKKTPPQEHFDADYSLDFNGFADTETSYFPQMGAMASTAAPLARVASTNTSIKRSETPRSAKTVLPVSDQHSKLKPGKSKPREHADFTATPPISPQDSTFPTDEQLSPGNDSATTYERSVRSPLPPKTQQKRRKSGSWSLPAITKSDADSDSFSKMFEDRGGRNILIFTSDEEDNQEEDVADEDDLPTPRLQKLEEDVQYPSKEWGMISAGKQFVPGPKDLDSMSDESAVYPPDIGRHHGGNESPLAMALQSMRHGGELGAAYKPPPQSRFTLRKGVNTAEILGRLGLKRTSTVSDRASTVASSTSGKSKEKARPTYHPASSSRGRLPVGQ